MYRILVSDKLGDEGLKRLHETEDASYELKTNLSKPQLLEEIAGYDALIVRSGTKVDEDVLMAGTRLKVVGRAGIGVDNIDIRAATKRGVIIMNTPQANAIATAEHAIGLMLAASRNVASAHVSLQAGEWRRSDFVGTQLYRKVLGIIGFGRIGRLVATRAHAFGMEIIAYDPYVSEEVAQEVDVTLVDFEDLLAQSDFVTLHSVLNPQTENLLNAAAIARMKPTAVVINGARGKLVDEHALAQALKEGRIAGAAIDVYRTEPPVSNPLIGLPNVVHTPHLGASTFEAQRDVATQIVDQVMDALRGEDFRNAINMPFQAGPGFAAIGPYLDLAHRLGVFQVALATGQIRKVEVEVSGEMDDQLIRPTAAALLKGILEDSLTESVNLINAPVLAEEAGITISQTRGLASADYPNLITTRVHWDGGQRLVSGALFGGKEPRIVQLDEHRLDANPQGLVLIMQNKDDPGVIGQVGTIMGTNKINIGEWRMGRFAPGSEALSFISLDEVPPDYVLEALELIPAVTRVSLVSL